MLAQTENVDHSLFMVPVTANTLKHAGSVVQGVGHDMHPGILERDEFAFKECVRFARVWSRLACPEHTTSPSPERSVACARHRNAETCLESQLFNLL